MTIWQIVGAVAFLIAILVIRSGIRHSRHAALCADGQHEMQPEEAKFYRWPGEGWNSVADTTTEKRETCRWCGHATEWVETRRSSLQGLSMSSERWDELKDKGRLRQWPYPRD